MTTDSFPGTAGALVLIGAVALFAACSSETPPPPAQTGQQVGFVPDRKPAPPVRWGDATIDAGTEISLTLVGSIGSASSRAGDRFQARVARAYIEGERVVIPEGSTIDGMISEATPAASAVGNQGGMLVLKFSRIVTPTGAAAVLKASLSKLPGGALATLPGKKVIVGGGPDRDVDLKEGTPLTVVLEDPLEIKVRI